MSDAHSGAWALYCTSRAATNVRASALLLLLTLAQHECSPSAGW
jgi:hypothetical protein